MATLDDTRSFENEFSFSDHVPLDFSDHSEEFEENEAETERADEYQRVRELTGKETQRINRARTFVLCCILAAGAFVSYKSYGVLTHEFRKDTRQKFENFAKTIELNVKFQVVNIFEANRALARAITTAANTGKQTFPDVIVPAFESHAYEARTQAGLLSVAYSPVVYDLEAWIEYSTSHTGWYHESKVIFDKLQPGLNRSTEELATIEPFVYRLTENLTVGEPLEQGKSGLFCPTMHISPPPLQSISEFMNIDVFSNTKYRDVGLASVELKDAVFSAFSADLKIFDGSSEPDLDVEQYRPYSVSAQPVYEGLGENENVVVGYIFSTIDWSRYLHNLLPNGINGIIIVVANSCGDEVTYEIHSGKPIYIGRGNLHDAAYADTLTEIEFSENYFDPTKARSTKGHCQVYLEVYSSSLFEDEYDSVFPVTFTIVVVFSFVAMSFVFLVYDQLVKKRNEKVETAAAQSNALVSSLFPSNVRDRLLEAHQKKRTKRGREANHRPTIKGFLSSSEVGNGMGEDASDVFKQKPIADLFPETTIMFADIAGFTAWSSVRDPTQVFILLETLYHAFDECAKMRRIFKVETIGDCYVAVCGLPDPRKDHAVNMIRFARDCMYKTWILTKRLETSLGPDTGDLTMRMGLHSGPVTAGVLRGERSRFQLFGDTMNTAARMESLGKKDQIHFSQDTANLLIAAGKGSWVRKREDKVVAKGKGEMQTYWLDLHPLPGTSECSSQSSGEEKVFDLRSSIKHTEQEHTVDEKIKRLVDWNMDVLVRLLREIVAKRGSRHDSSNTLKGELDVGRAHYTTVLDEVAEVIMLAKFKNDKGINPENVVLSPEVVGQLQNFIERIAKMYHSNPFHNFEHASHVTMSVVKLLARIVAPTQFQEKDVDASTLHDHTFGLASDPMVQFACVISAIIHDLDHPGVPNSQLVKEKSTIAAAYKNKSVAEQNSVDLAWNLLMGSEYKALRSAVYSSETEMYRFRQLVVNSVMATDIMDPELKALRNSRWDKAFHEDTNDLNERIDVKNTKVHRKATIVIEHLIQASDVAHTMQHWHVYRKWNERFFMECYKAWKLNRADSNPAINWYKGEIGFFDFYIIPLAKKLKDCGVFGVSSHEYLNYAMKNRQEWEERGAEVVSEMVELAEATWQEEKGTYKELSILSRRADVL